jgi:hypothetical protein
VFGALDQRSTTRFISRVTSGSVRASSYEQQRDKAGRSWRQSQFGRRIESYVGDEGRELLGLPEVGVQDTGTPQ